MTGQRNLPGGPEALARGDAVFQERFWIFPSSTPSSTAVSPVSARVILLTDGMCASSCWQFVKICFRSLGQDTWVPVPIR